MSKYRKYNCSHDTAYAYTTVFLFIYIKDKSCHGSSLQWNEHINRSFLKILFGFKKANR